MRTLAALGLLLAALFAGCSAPGPAADPAHPAAVPTFAAATAIGKPCAALRQVECFEASVAADPEGRIFTANTSCDAIARSGDGGRTFEAVAVPPPTREMVPPSDLGDCTVQVDPQGRLWFSALAREAGANPLTGLQVARSDDGGATWAVDHFFAATVPPPHLPSHATDLPIATNADRQWLAFAPDGGVWFAYWDWQVGQTFVTRSADSGESWASMAPMPGYLAGPLLVGRDGTLHSPSQDFGDPYTILDTQSSDGSTFRQVEVHAGAKGQTWGAYPTMAEAPDGTLFMAWQAESGQQVLVASSHDGGATWGAPVPWTLAGAHLTPGQRQDRDGACPKVGVVGDALVVMWYEQAGDRQEARVAWAPLGQAEAGPVARATAATYGAAHQTTDFADFAALPGGRLAVGFTDPDAGLRVAVASQAWSA